ncbi:hypothetical protein M407DRAFT_242320 [Tulasnella calospora MUT 4182]|uniref:Enoyl reductase (ER) domain-containing protein n=1 Tax=Tulasnella calospora MUT 4182 TaxID=1051891 RepID=A0A0C3L8G5_9AGAM|nr:hypothetical protein M407DRAFT_242320 [Tulasnella calospora MUT 4182]
MSALPQNHRAVIVKEGDPRTLAVEERALPALRDDEILVKVKAVTLNPTDYKHVWNYAQLKGGSSFGCDFAGDVAYVGKDVKGWSVGDGAAGFLRGGIPDETNGSFQEYVRTRPELAWHIPKDVLTYEDAAAMGGIALSTAVTALFIRLGLPTPWNPAKEDTYVLIWAGSTSVGIFANRFAKLAGLKVATTASPKNHPLMKQLGVDLVLDYKDPEAPAKIKEWSKGQLTHAFDTISERGSTKLAAEAFGDKGGTVITLLPVQKPEDGSALATRVDPLRIYVYGGLDVSDDPQSDYAKLVEWYSELPKYAKDMKVMPIKRWPGGLDALPEALEYLKAGKASAEKIAITL